MELLMEYNKVKDEAEWSRKKLAEAVMMLHQKQEQPHPPSQSQAKEALMSSTDRYWKSSFGAFALVLLLLPLLVTNRADVDESAAEYSMDFVNISTADLSPTLPPLKQQLSDSPKLNKEPLLRSFHELKTSSAPSAQQQNRYENISGSSTPFFPTTTMQPSVPSQQLGSDPLTESVAKSFLASQV